MKNISEMMSSSDRSNFRPVADYQHQQDADESSEERAAWIFNRLISQLRATFPAAMANFKTQDDLNEFRRQWVLAFIENGITSMAQIDAGMKHARKQESPYLPSPGKFVSWCKDASIILGINITDVMTEFHRYSKEKGLHSGGPERFPWRHPVMYWIVCDTRRAMYQRQLSDAEVEKHAKKLLDEWAQKVAAGHQIPDPVLSIQAKPEPINTPPDTGGSVYHPPGRSFGCMPNSATLGGMTPAQWLMEEYRRGKAAGIIQ